jgi:hypothetical protein
MGGATEHVEHPNVPLCRGCHEAVHAKRFTLMINGDFASTWEKGHPVSERALTVNDSHEDMRYWSDEALAVGWGQVHEQVVGLLEYQCRIAYEFERRYSWLDHWYEGAAQILGRNTGYVVHPRDVYRKADLWRTFAGRWQDYAFLGARVAISVAEASEPEEALAFATSQVDENAASRTDIAQDVKDRWPRAASRGESCTCPECGAKHRRRKAAGQ